MMGQHTRGAGADRWILPAAGVLAVLGLVIAGALAVFDHAPDDDDFAREACQRPIRVVTATSFAPVLNALAAQTENDDDCVRLDVTPEDGRAAVQRAIEVGADVWIPDDASWAGSAGSLGLVQPPKANAGAVLATSPFYMVADRATGEKLRKAGGGWLGLSGLVGPGRDTRLVVRDPIGSGDGMVAAGAVAEAVWVDKGMDASALWLAGAQKTTRIVTDGSPALPTRAGEIGVVPEYALRAALTDAGDKTVLPGTDHTAMLRYAWFPIASAAADPVRDAALDRLYRALTGPEGVAPIRAAGLRTPDTAQAAGDSGLPAPKAPPLGVLGPHHVDHVFATWYPDDRRTNLLVVVDVSGSMGARTAGSTASRIELVRQGCRSVGALLPADSRMGLWEFGSELDGKKDYRTLLGMGPLSPGHRKALGTAIDKLTAQDTGTGLYDTILAAYSSALNSYREGVPNQVLIFTDGRNESDENSITAADLAAGLRKAADPRRPIHLSVVTFGTPAKAKVVENAVKPVSGYVDVLTNAEQVAAVFIHVAAGGLHH
jgi:hypothetical protein